MGCVPSKLFAKDRNHRSPPSAHVVSLTSTTYGVLKLDREPPPGGSSLPPTSRRSPPPDAPEIVDARELMKGLDDDDSLPENPPHAVKSLAGNRTAAETRSPLKRLNRVNSPRKSQCLSGKENEIGANGLRGRAGRLDQSPTESLKACSLPESAKKTAGSGAPGTRKSGHLRAGTAAASDEKCREGGENAVVLYTTTLRGVRRTFEECNRVRGILESCGVRVVERDVSMDSGFREELRRRTGAKWGVKVPAVFVKGRLVGGEEEVVRVEEEGKLGILLEGIPKAIGGCQGCGGLRFVICSVCHGSCKVLGANQKSTVRCGECNENGLIRCPLCT